MEVIMNQANNVSEADTEQNLSQTVANEENNLKPFSLEELVADVDRENEERRQLSILGLQHS